MRKHLDLVLLLIYLILAPIALIIIALLEELFNPSVSIPISLFAGMCFGGAYVIKKTLDSIIKEEKKEKERAGLSRDMYVEQCGDELFFFDEEGGEIVHIPK